MWDDLFRAAAGQGDSGISESRTQTVEKQTNQRKQCAPTISEPSSHKKRGKKRRRSRDSRKPSQELLQQVLFSRTDSIDQQIWSKLPFWLLPGVSLDNSSRCSGWKHDGDCLLISKCMDCKRTLLHHSIVVSPSTALNHSSIRKVLTSFALIRDIRCCCHCILKECYLSKGYKQANNSNPQDYIITALNKSNELVNVDFSSILTPGEADILTRKFNEVKSVAASLAKNRHHLPQTELDKKFNKGGIFDEIIRLMMSCDAAYFRMYYLQNSGNLPIENQNIFLPHPPTYFGSKNLAWNVFDHTKRLMETIRKNNKHIHDKKWDSYTRDLGTAPSSGELDSLSFMQKNRQSESILIFRKTGWMRSKEVKAQFIKSIRLEQRSEDMETRFYTKHETPAPHILRLWRDSCRDFLCNLYAYATVSPEMIDDVKTVFRVKDIACNDIIEIGAGTGYVADLLSTAGFSVEAFDVAPCRSMASPHVQSKPNEYHGSSPSFFHVQNGDAKSLQTVLNRSKAKETALLLCYPPPLSDMAERSLKLFASNGGRIVIHIGEFSGLTGSPGFENLLSYNFDLVHRARCLNWGSDAAELTVWIKFNQPQRQRSQTLIQCSQCKKQGAKNRFRMCRPLSYCTEACFSNHSVERGLHFAFNMIPNTVGPDALRSFGECHAEEYFESLPCKYDL